MDIKNDIRQALSIITRGGIILYPTDTIWGIGCDATDGNAIKRIFDLKNREEKKSMIILVDDLTLLRDYVSDPPPKLLNFMFSAQKPTTGIFAKAMNLPANLVNENGSVAIRIARDVFCNELIRELKKPLVSTSANISGEPSPENFSAVSDKIKSGVDYIVQHRQDDNSKSSSSAIVKVDQSGAIVFIRH